MNISPFYFELKDYLKRHGPSKVDMNVIKRIIYLVGKGEKSVAEEFFFHIYSILIFFSIENGLKYNPKSPLFKGKLCEGGRGIHYELEKGDISQDCLELIKIYIVLRTA